MKLSAIKDTIPANSTSLREISTKKRLLKTKLKLLNIYYFDNDLHKIHENKQDLSHISIDDFYLTEDSQLIALVKDRIIPSTSISKTIISSYLIYLSYLYNYDFTKLYNDDASLCIKLINSLELPNSLKTTFSNLINNPIYFSLFLKELNTSNYSSIIEKDKQRLLTLN